MKQSSRSALDAWLKVDALLSDQAGEALPFGEDDNQPEPIGKLWGRLVKERDLELHVRTGWFAGEQWVQLLDFVPSTGSYEANLLVEWRILGPLLEKLASIRRHLGGTSLR